MYDELRGVPSVFVSKVYTGLPVVGAHGKPNVDVGPEVATGDDTVPAV